MYVVYLKTLGAAKPLIRKNQTGKSSRAFLWFVGFRVKPTNHFSALFLWDSVACSCHRLRVDLLPNWQSPRPSPFLTLPLRRRVFENSIDQRRSKKPESEFLQPNNQNTSKRKSTDRNQPKPPPSQTAESPRPAVIIQ